MKKTQNFQLSQWDETDRILREDFNTDNAKIDAAIAAACPIVKLLDITTTAAAQQIDLDFSNIHLANYRKVLLYPEISGSTYVRLNGHCGNQDYGRAGCTTYSNLGSLIDSTKGVNRMEFFCNANGKVFGEIFAVESEISSSGILLFSNIVTQWCANENIVRANQLNSINLIGDNVLPAGAHFTAYGVKR